MSLVKKQAQHAGSSHLDGIMVRPEDLSKLLNDVGDLRANIDVEPEDSDEEKALQEGANVKGEVTIEVEDGDDLHKDFSFTLPKVPGGESQEEIEEPSEMEVEEPEEEIEIVSDPWKWQLHSFMPWWINMLEKIPHHSGKDISGIERAVAYLEACEREGSKAVRMDIDGTLDINEVERIRDEIHDGIKRLLERGEQIRSSKRPSKNKKKKADYDAEIIKEANAAYTGHITVTVPLLISSLARSCINGMVSAGHDIEDIFRKVAKEYDLTKREKLELQQLLYDMNYPMRKDLGMPLDKETDMTSSDNVNWNANYPA
jgi:hypothetical protein